ncbi:MAG: glycerophosphodiester phosphodiesterase [Propionibacteriaceae bacterium]|jgi:glycerophosphoryl diester phosphodiesterase|nr:glycerophosphodiester phosphodiesterase [Propionibacteriaceae bacterium]
MSSQPHFLDQPFAAMAHRGGAGLPSNLGRENTLAAFRQAVDLGYRYIETDVRTSRDGRLVLFHDADLSRLTGQPGPVQGRSWAELSQLEVGGEPIASLDAALEEFPHTRFNIDLKSDSAVEPLIRLLARQRAGRRVLVTSFSPFRLSRFRRLGAGLATTGATPLGVAWTTFLPGLPGLCPGPATALQVPLSVAWGRRRIDVFGPNLVRNAHRGGQRVHVWTVDDPETMDQVIDAGADGIVTDRPDLLKQVLRRRGMWETDHD